MTERILWTYDQVGKYLGCSRRTISRYVEQGVLPVVRIGPRMRRIDRKDVDKAFRSKRLSRQQEIEASRAVEDLERSARRVAELGGLPSEKAAHLARIIDADEVA